MGQYEPLFAINAKHTYFFNHVCQALDWVPTQATRQTMDNLGMLFRTQAGGMTVFFDPRYQEAVSLFAAQMASDQDSFFFKLYSKDPFFLNYTNLPETDTDTVIFLDSAKAQGSNSGALRLHGTAFVSKASIVALSNLKNTPILTRNDRGAPPICILRICMVGEKVCPMDAKGNIRPQSFCIHFQPRHTYWKYYITGPLAEKKISILDKTGQWSFGQTSSIEATVSQPTAAFISNTPIPLGQRTQTHFLLKLHTPKAEKVLIKKLPAAPINILHREKRGKKEILVSEIFINS